MSKLFWKSRDHLGWWALDYWSIPYVLLFMFHIYIFRKTQLQWKGSNRRGMEKICGPEIAKQFKNLATGEMFLHLYTSLHLDSDTSKYGNLCPVAFILWMKFCYRLRRCRQLHPPFLPELSVEQSHCLLVGSFLGRLGLIQGILEWYSDHPLSDLRAYRNQFIV